LLLHLSNAIVEDVHAPEETAMECNCQELYRINDLCNSVNNIIMLANSTLDAEEIMSRIIVETAKGVRCDSARIVLREDGQWITRYVYGLPAEINERVFSDGELPHAALALITKKPLAIEDAFTDTRTNIDLMRSYGIRSVLVLPLLEQDSVMGVLLLNYHEQLQTFQEADVDYAGKVAGAVAIAFRNARRFLAMQCEREALADAKVYRDALSRIETTIYTALDSDEIMRTVLQQASEAIGAETAMIFTREGDDWIVRYVSKLSLSLLGRRFSNDQVRHTAVTAETMQPLAVVDAANDDRVNQDLRNMRGG
jgi:GAF domain-containing protein